MTTAKPKFLDSPFFVIGKGIENWTLKREAPKEIVKEFNNFKKSVYFAELRRSGDRMTGN